MKLLFSTVTLFILLVLVTPNLRAQSYGPYYDPYWDAQYQQYLQWQQYLQYLQQNDPYYELHAMHWLSAALSAVSNISTLLLFIRYTCMVSDTAAAVAKPLLPGQIGLEEGKSTSRCGRRCVEHFAEASLW